MIKKLKVLIIYFIFNIGVLDASEKIDQNEIFKNLRCLVC